MNANILKKMKRMKLLATDLDRTLIPNGKEIESDGVRFKLAEILRQQNILTVFVTGRDPELVRKAMEEYHLPKPDFAITDVGSRIYRIKNRNWKPVEPWIEYLQTAWNERDAASFIPELAYLKELRIQEASKQSRFKLSYYLDLDADREKVEMAIDLVFKEWGSACTQVWSIDEAEQVLLLDIMPPGVNKLSSLQFLTESLDICETEMIFSGDSGNDLEVMESSIPSVLVANAVEEVKKEALTRCQKNKNLNRLYIAEGKLKGNNGNYAGGILEGIQRFFPDMPGISLLKQ